MATEERHNPEVLREYEGAGITVRWEPGLCIHVTNCIRSLPGVFDPNARPWVRIDAAEADSIAAAILTCPTGALAYNRTDEAPQEAPDVPMTVEPRPSGPLFVRGDIRVLGREGKVIRSATRAAFCSCGHSNNKPFCDLSHRTIGFKSD